MIKRGLQIDIYQIVSNVDMVERDQFSHPTSKLQGYPMESIGGMYRTKQRKYFSMQHTISLRRIHFHKGW